jgi:hypothetical protein
MGKYEVTAPNVVMGDQERKIGEVIELTEAGAANLANKVKPVGGTVEPQAEAAAEAAPAPKPKAKPRAKRKTKKRA